MFNFILKYWPIIITMIGSVFGASTYFILHKDKYDKFMNLLGGALLFLGIPASFIFLGFKIGLLNIIAAFIVYRLTKYRY